MQPTFIILAKKKFLVLLLLIAGLFSFAQPAKFVTVIDAQSKLPIPYTTLKSIGKQTGTYTDSAGNFFITADFSDSLRVSSVGYSSVVIHQNSILKIPFIYNPILGC